MAAAQVAKKLKDKRQQRTIEGIFKKLDKDGKGSISLYDYFGMFESHGIEVTQSETRRVVRLAGDDGLLTKENFFKIVQGSDFFLKSFDKNNDGEVTETDIMTRAELAFGALDRNKKGYITAKDLGKLTKKLSKEEVNSLLVKLDTDGDGQLSFDEFKVLFENADKRKKDTEKKSQENLTRHHSAKAGGRQCEDKESQSPLKRKESLPASFARLNIRGEQSRSRSGSNSCLNVDN